MSDTWHRSPKTPHEENFRISGKALTKLLRTELMRLSLEGQFLGLLGLLGSLVLENLDLCILLLVSIPEISFCSDEEQHICAVYHSAQYGCNM